MLVAPEVTVKALDVSVKPNLTVGYVMGVGDEVPAALEQLGVKLTFIGADDLAWGDLSQLRRDHDRRPRLRAAQRSARLQPAVARLRPAGGTVIVQYNKFEFNDAQYGPVSRQGRPRARDRRKRGAARARTRAPGVQLAEHDWPRATGLAGCRNADSISSIPAAAIRNTRTWSSSNEPFPYNQGNKRGALVEAKVGQGRWIYVGLGLWRQLPAGTDGAFRLMANLLSLGGR